jgi:hypothetical protein
MKVKVAIVKRWMRVEASTVNEVGIGIEEVSMEMVDVQS